MKSHKPKDNAEFSNIVPFGNSYIQKKNIAARPGILRLGSDRKIGSLNPKHLPPNVTEEKISLVSLQNIHFDA